MPIRSSHALEPSLGIDVLRLLVLTVVGIMAALLSNPRVVGKTPLEPQHMVVFAFALAGLWFMVDLIEKQLFRRIRSDDLDRAATIVHRTGEVSRAVFPLAVGGIVAIAVAVPLGGFCNRLFPGREAGSIAAILLTAGLAIGTAKLVTIARYGLRSRALQLRPDALVLDGHRERTIPWHEISDARLAFVRNRRHSIPYLALALADPARHGLRPVPFWRRLMTGGAVQGDTLLTNLDIFLDRPEEIVEDVRRFIRRHNDPDMG